MKDFPPFKGSEKPGGVAGFFRRKMCIRDRTTTLRILGGFVTPDKGKVIFDGQDITRLPPYKRQLNTVFQKYALFPHMNIAENIAFGLKIKNKPKSLSLIHI